MEKRIALCFSGQPRTWHKCYDNWMENLSHLGQIDTFFHFWDYNTLPTRLLHEQRIPSQNVLISDEEKNDIVATFEPKKYEFDSRQLQWPTPPDVKTQVSPWARNQFLSMNRAAFLKRQYEIENNFEYDLVIRMRADLVFENPLGHIITEPNTVYTVHNGYDVEFNRYRVGDLFFAADSYTFDQLCDFHYALDYVDALNVVAGTTTYPPELAFYYYFKSIGIQNTSVTYSVRVARTDEHAQIVGKLYKYEVV